MTLGEFLNNDNLLNLESEAKQNKDKFKTLMKEAEICLFGKTLDPIIYTNECDFTKTNDISDPELNKKGLYLFRYFFSRYTTIHNHLYESNHLLENGLYFEILSEEFFNNYYDKISSLSNNSYPLNMDDRNRELNTIINYFTGKEYEPKNSFVVNYDITPEDDEFNYFYYDSFYPKFNWYWFPLKVNFRNSIFEFLNDSNLENFYQLLFEKSIENSIQKQNNFKIKKDKIQNINIEPLPVERSTLVITNQQLLYSFRPPSYKCKRNLLQGTIDEANPFEIIK